MPSPLAWSMVTLVVTLCAAVQGTIGFGLALLAAPLLTFIDARLVPGPLLCAGLVLTAMMTARERSEIDVKAVLWALAGRVPGVALGATVLSVVTTRTLGIVIGLVVLAAVAITMSGVELQRKPTTLVGAGMLSGFMGTTASIGGPPLALVYQSAEGPHARATLSAYFMAGVVMSLSALLVIGRFARFELLWALALAPGIALGFVLSSKTARWLDQERHRLRSGVLLVSAASGLLVIVRQVLTAL